MAVGADAVADGVVDSIARPGGNITGSTFFGPESLEARTVLRDKILEGDTPATIPIEQASRFALVFNLKTAWAMGLRIQQSLILRADHVIE